MQVPFHFSSYKMQVHLRTAANFKRTKSREKKVQAALTPNSPVCHFHFPIISGDATKLSATIIFVMDVVRHVLKVLHVCADQHIPQRDEIAVFHVLNCPQGRSHIKLIIKQ